MNSYKEQLDKAESDLELLRDAYLKEESTRFKPGDPVYGWNEVDHRVIGNYLGFVDNSPDAPHSIKYGPSGTVLFFKHMELVRSALSKSDLCRVFEAGENNKGTRTSADWVKENYPDAL
jgi:hypothetical protein